MATAGTRRPSDSKRILAQLEHGVRPAAHPARAAGWTVDGWTISLFALLLLMCCVAWLMHDKTITPKTFRHSYSSSSSSGVARKAAEGAPAVELPAVIVNEAPSPAVEVEELAGAQASWSPTATAQSVRIVSPQLKASTPATRTVVVATPAANPTPAMPVSDTDVALLTALVAHASKPATVTPERPRDVVERQEGDTTTQLLARCKQLGLIEGMLCRSRICSGRWENDAACRAPSH
ncbi:hypothetical protein GTP46_21900 [Duganella sp. FT135W]|uniref:Uncharacterized protein n=2 Tax=Duganella flavida TaxID=2692175 RepID=A0A6L8KGC3_9BURK|nr:hypothetical protein [Duganella flavida]